MYYVHKMPREYAGRPGTRFFTMLYESEYFISCLDDHGGENPIIPSETCSQNQKEKVGVNWSRDEKSRGTSGILSRRRFRESVPFSHNQEKYNSVLTHRSVVAKTWSYMEYDNMGRGTHNADCSSIEWPYYNDDDNCWGKTHTPTRN